MKLSKRARRHLTGILGILSGLAVAYLLVFSQAGYLQLQRSQQELDVQIQENRRLRQELNQYWERIERLKNDPAEMERLMRESNYARPSEIVVTLPDDE